MKVLGVSLDLANKQVKNLADGSAATDAVTKQQLDASVRGLDWKASVRAASTANLNIASPGSSIDGVAMAAGERFLAKDQSTASQNGIYVWNGAATPATRAADADENAEVTSGLAVTVTEGTVNGDKVFTLSTNDPIVVATTGLTFAQVGGGSSPYTAGNGLNLSGQTFAVVPGAGILADGTSTRIDPSVVVRKFSANVGNGALTTIPIAHGLGSADLTVTVRDSATGEVVYPDITIDATNVTLVFSVAPASNAYRVTVHG